MQVVFSVADRISVLHQGAIVADDTPEEIRRSPQVQQIYLGEFVEVVRHDVAMRRAMTDGAECSSTVRQSRRWSQRRLPAPPGLSAT